MMSSTCVRCKQDNPRNIQFRIIKTMTPCIYKVRHMIPGVYIQAKDILKYYEKWYSKNVTNSFNQAHAKFYKDLKVTEKLIAEGERIFNEHGQDKWIYVGPSTLFSLCPQKYECNYHLFLAEAIPEFTYKSYPLLPVCYTCNKTTREAELATLSKAILYSLKIKKNNDSYDP